MSGEHSFHKELTFKLHKLSFLTNRLAEQALTSKTKLTLSQFWLLMAIDRCGDGSQRMVSKFMDVTQAAVSRLSDTMIEKGFVERKPNPMSRREHILELTADGKKELSNALSVLRKTSADFYAAALSKTEVEALTTSLDKLVSQAKTQLNPEGGVHDKR